MPFTRPTLQEISTRVEQDLVTRLNLKGPLLRRSVVAVLARVVAGAVHGLYGFLVFLSEQIFPDTSVSTYMLRQAELYGITQTPATYAEGTVIATGTNGTLIPAGTVLARADGTTYATQADELVYEGEAAVSVLAASAGVTGNVDPGTSLTFVTPIGGVDANAAVDEGGLINGADIESIDSVSARTLEVLRSPAQGGSADDYIKWAKQRQGVSRVWVYPQQLTLNGVTVLFVRDGDGSGDAIIPDEDEIDAVASIIEAVRPVGADVTVAGPTAADVAFTIHLNDDTVDARAAVEAELQDLFTRVGAPGGTIYLSSLRTAIGVAVGDDDFTLTSPNADVTKATGHLPIVGAFTWD